MPHATTHRVLFIDAYDSFTNNIVALLETHLHVSVTVIKIDEPIPHLADFLKSFSAVIAGPGPGDPRKRKDVGWFRQLWELEGQDLLPVLGICLGFQSLVLAFGGRIDRLGEPRHGVVRRVRGTGESIFRAIKEVETVQYHSLYASLGSEGKLERTESHDFGKPSIKCSDLRPLAWDYEMDNVGESTEDAVSLNLQRVLMAVEHKSKPFFGIQFHAESICSSREARKVIEAWWDIAMKWKIPSQDIDTLPNLDRMYHANLKTWQDQSTDESPLANGQKAADDSKITSIATNGGCNRAIKTSLLQQDLRRCSSTPRSQFLRRKKAIWITAGETDIENATIPSICEMLGLTDGEAIILDSEMHQRRDVGEYSIIGLVSPNSLRIEYQIGTNEVRQVHGEQTETVDLRHYGGCIFPYLKSFMGHYKVHKPSTKVPFWGGLMGFISYEACLETIGIVHSQCRTGMDSLRPDLSFVFVERSIVIDHSQQKIHVQTIKGDDQDWVDKTVLQLKGMGRGDSSSTTPYPLASNTHMSLPNVQHYKSKIQACQSAIRAGDSYELCLTNQATIRTRKRLAAWPRYLRLRSLNAAPFSAYVRLGRLTILSSSPERFLQWSRPIQNSNLRTEWGFNREEETIRCQFRPIKGTIQRQPDPNIPPLTLAKATALLATPKERAENLMIVDLIRHDLYGVVGSAGVSVPKLMVVEEYATLFQLVSVIEGSLVVKGDCDEAISNEDNLYHSPTTPNISNHLGIPNPYNSKTGLDILAASLPPGSMTGAPKLRSCQLLHNLERRPRGIYSGVLGYLDIGGGGDFSVVIRTAVRWDKDVPKAADGENGRIGKDGDHVDGVDGVAGRKEEEEEEAMGKYDDHDEDEWTIGAGGAVTSLSTEDGEWEEMCAKMRSTLRLFE